MSSYRFSGSVGGTGNHFGDDGTVVNVARSPAAAQAAAALVREVRAAGGLLPDGVHAEAAAVRIATELSRPQPDLPAVAALLDSLATGAGRLPAVSAAVGLVRAAVAAGT